MAKKMKMEDIRSIEDLAQFAVCTKQNELDRLATHLNRNGILCSSKEAPEVVNHLLTDIEICRMKFKALLASNPEALRKDGIRHQLFLIRETGRDGGFRYSWIIGRNGEILDDEDDGTGLLWVNGVNTYLDSDANMEGLRKKSEKYARSLGLSISETEATESGWVKPR
jgi:hypothetical protein